MTVAMLASAGIDPELQFHTSVAPEQQVTKGEQTGMLLLAQIYAGMPRAKGAANIIRDVVLSQ